MKIAVLAEEESWHTADFCRAAQKCHDVKVMRLSQLGAILGTSGGSQIWCGSERLELMDAVFVRTIPAGSLEQIVFRMDALAELARCGVTVVNPAKTVEACVDKYLALCLLQRAGIAVPETIVCQESADAMKQFRRLGQRVVLKPVFGSEGRGLVLLDNEDLAARAFAILQATGETIYMQRFIEHGNRDTRVFVAGEAMLGMRRYNPGDWRVNATRGAETSRHEITKPERETALRVCDALGAIVAGIDLVCDQDGKIWVLEVNSAPGWKHISRVCEADVPGLIVNAIETERSRCTQN